MAQTINIPARAPLWRGSLFYFVFFGGIGAIVPFINVYFSQLGLNGRQIGLLATFLPLFTVVASPFVSALADSRNQRRRFLQLLAILYALAIYLLGFTHTFVTILPFFALQALAVGCIQPLGDGVVTSMARRYRLNFGQMRLWGSIGVASTGIALGALWQQIGFGSMFIAAGGIFLLLALVSQLLDEPTNRRVKVQGERPFRTLLQNQSFTILLVIGFLLGIAFAMLIVFEGIFAVSLGGGEFLVGLLVGAGAIAEVPSMRLSGSLAERWGYRPTLLLGYTLFGIAVLAYSWVTNPTLLVPVAILRGTGFGLFFPTTLKLVSELAPEEWSATAQSMLTAVTFGLSPLIAGPVGGFILDTWGAASIFTLAGTAVFFSILVLILTYRRLAFN
ncbi:MAG: MFS transporter [Anaerolineales bacterium]|nr:MFS transporter [Anaerolineales bacterium]